MRINDFMELVEITGDYNKVSVLVNVIVKETGEEIKKYELNGNIDTYETKEHVISELDSMFNFYLAEEGPNPYIWLESVWCSCGGRCHYTINIEI